MQRPPDIDDLGPVLDRLVTRGGARVPHNWRTYLASVGVAAAVGDDGWMCPTQCFLRHALPARDKGDLIRRAVIRDPLYRLHVDLCLCSVIHSVAVSERWNRLEELLFGPCRPVAPRLAQLLMWSARQCDLPIQELPSAKLQQLIDKYGDPSFVTWRKRLWGESRTPADLFPLLLDLYVPLAGQPYHVSADADLNRLLLGSLIAAAREGEGVSLPSTERDDLIAMQELGLPIRIVTHVNDRLYVHLVGTIETIASDGVRVGERIDIPSGVPSIAKHSRLIPGSDSNCCWTASNGTKTPFVAPVSVDDDATRWPAQSIADAPGWLLLPGSELISTAARHKKDSEGAEVALQQIACHPLYGFLLQLLLLEALDRELGDDTLALALPQNQKLETEEDWAETKVLYRPREAFREAAISEADGFLELGAVDDIFPMIAHEVGILGIATPYDNTLKPWTRAVYLMSTAGIIDGRPHSWRLTITPFILDRLHSGSLMKDVIRNGRSIRDQMHHVLSTLWKERTTPAGKEHKSA